MACAARRMSGSSAGAGDRERFAPRAYAGIHRGHQDRRAAGAGAVAEVSVVAGAVPIGLPDQRRLPRRGPAGLAGRSFRGAGQRISSRLRGSWRRLLHLQRADRRARCARRRGRDPHGRRARHGSALRQRHRATLRHAAACLRALALRQRLLGQFLLSRRDGAASRGRRESSLLRAARRLRPRDAAPHHG